MKKLIPLIFILIIGYGVNCFAFVPTPSNTATVDAASVNAVEADPIVGNVIGIVKADGAGNISASTTEEGADVTDATNVAAAGATMETDANYTSTATTNADPYTVSKTASKRNETVAITNTQGDGTNIRFSETNAVNGDIIFAINLSAAYLEVEDVASQQYVGGYVRLDQNNTIAMKYSSALSAWVKVDLQDIFTVASIDTTGGTTTKGSITTGYHIETVSALDVSAAASLDVTPSTTVGAGYLNTKYVVLNGDNDSADEEIDLQDGTSGITVCFMGGTGLDTTDDAAVIDASTDSTCTGCPGTIELDEQGDMVCFTWTSNSSWLYHSAVDAQ